MTNKKFTKKIGQQGSTMQNIRMIELQNQMLDKISGFYDKLKGDGVPPEQITAIFGGMGATSKEEEIETEEDEQEKQDETEKNILISKMKK